MEEALRSAGYKEIYMNARTPVVSYYKERGYELKGEEFIEIGISHQKMFKKL